MAVPIVEATRSYERWLATRFRLRRDDLEYKHDQMAADTFSFLRASFYRWAQLWPEELPELADAPKVLAAGDLHVENFGTWRDQEGRLVWGLNDFDEAVLLPYTSDLVRLATSAGLAAAEGDLNLDLKEACAAIIAGYTGSLRSGGRPMVLAENDRWLRKLATGRLRDPIEFWQRMRALPVARGTLPSKVQGLLLQALPDGVTHLRFVRRRAGLGGLGLDRLVALGDWDGSAVAHEARVLAPPAWEWAQQPHASGRIHYVDLLAGAVRCPDPMTEVREGWLVRRLSLRPHRAGHAAAQAGRGASAQGDGLGVRERPPRHARGGESDPRRPVPPAPGLAARRGHEDGAAGARRLEGMAHAMMVR